ncbi:MAG TPA: hypothetical protein PKE53_03955 [Flavobacteriales bacterium]|nr:hypothetical protein [Flavobacteriales bacterium]
MPTMKQGRRKLMAAVAKAKAARIGMMRFATWSFPRSFGVEGG